MKNYLLFVGFVVSFFSAGSFVYAMEDEERLVGAYPGAQAQISEWWKQMNEGELYFFSTKGVLTPLKSEPPLFEGIKKIEPHKASLPKELKNKTLLEIIEIFVKNPLIAKAYEEEIMESFVISKDDPREKLRGQKGVKATQILLDRTLLGVYPGRWVKDSEDSEDLTKAWQNKAAPEAEKFKGILTYAMGIKNEKNYLGVFLDGYESKSGSFMPLINSIEVGSSRGNLNVAGLVLLLKGQLPVFIYFTIECVPEGFELLTDYRNKIKKESTPDHGEKLRIKNMEKN